jgi:hypothetical protein
MAFFTKINMEQLINIGFKRIKSGNLPTFARDGFVVMVWNNSYYHNEEKINIEDIG